MTANDRRQREKRGRAAETRAAWALRLKGYRIAANPGLAGMTHRFDAVFVVPRKWPYHVINAWPESPD